jgi:phospholipase C
LAGLGVALVTIGAAAAAPHAAAAPPLRAALAADPKPATPIRHFIFLMQGGRTFDNYFGTYPGADGLTGETCQPVALSDPGAGCVRPFVLDGTRLAPLSANRTIVDGQWHNGKMDGFVAAYQQQGRDGNAAMGHFDAAALPWYWQAASQYVLFDHFFSDARYGIRDNRSYWVSARPAPSGAGRIPAGGYGNQPTIFDRLQAARVSWKFYVQDYNPRQTFETASPDNPQTQTARVPLVDFYRFVHDPELASHIVGLDQYYRDLAAGTLPAVAYVASSAGTDERSAQTIQSGQSLVATMTTQLMESPYWDSTALMWSYDSSGGWFDGMRPPQAGGTSLGFRVPAVLVSAYARKGQVNHAALDFTSALKFIEQNWRLAPLTTRDADAGRLDGAFDFTAGPRPAVLVRAGQPRDPYPVARPISQRQRAAIYELYGAAAGLSVILLAVAVLLSALSGRRKAARASAPSARETTGPAVPVTADPARARGANGGAADPGTARIAAQGGAAAEEAGQ